MSETTEFNPVTRLLVTYLTKEIRYLSWTCKKNVSISNNLHSHRKLQYDVLLVQDHHQKELSLTKILHPSVSRLHYGHQQSLTPCSLHLSFWAKEDWSQPLARHSFGHRLHWKVNSSWVMVTSSLSTNLPSDFAVARAFPMPLSKVSPSLGVGGGGCVASKSQILAINLSVHATTSCCSCPSLYTPL